MAKKGKKGGSKKSSSKRSSSKKSNAKKIRNAKKSVAKKIKKAASDRKVTKKELKKIKSYAKKKGLDNKKFNIGKRVKKYVKKDSNKIIKNQIKSAGKDGKITKKEALKIKNKAKKKGISIKDLGFKYNVSKASKKKTQNYIQKYKKKGKKTKVDSKLLGKIKGKDFLKLGIKTDNQLDKKFKKNLVDRIKLKGDSWKPSKVENAVAQQWGKRFKNENFKPKRLNVKVAMSERLAKYSDKNGKFNHQKYLGDVKAQTAKRAQERGFKGDALKALSRKGPEIPTASTPKYGSAITDLKNKLGTINYKDQITKTTSKLTQTVKSDASKFKQTGLNIIKRRSSEDGAVPHSS